MEDQKKMEISCGMCQWFVPSAAHQNKAGECRVEHPALLVVPTSAFDQWGKPLGHEIQAAFPTIPATLWCGQFRPKVANLGIEQPEEVSSVVAANH